MPHPPCAQVIEIDDDDDIELYIAGSSPRAARGGHAGGSRRSRQVPSASAAERDAGSLEPARCARKARFSRGARCGALQPLGSRTAVVSFASACARASARLCCVSLCPTATHTNPHPNIPRDRVRSRLRRLPPACPPLCVCVCNTHICIYMYILYIYVCTKY